ncbi:flavin-containing monooxygenase [Mycolicibacterium austroafricanum]|uniref:flavin-containing monooxygenase n=1 Tax=Mycolicibacterium austroafricanum TaxID=39687 RepID=UPI001CA35BFD|nr:NAD(P)/FAD-dependent oxidoreductase [Mycolicibacterium austroafricanum]QZT64964.1 NAD(P)/FAD-dependent oxidoreductase [Mycolicibacterium austroafricanum]
MTVQQPLDAIVVGAGFGGIGSAIQLKKLGYHNLAILDREDDLGGVWHVNRYPGLAVDIPSPTYSFWFEPNPHWSRMYAPGAEIKQYARDVADKYDVRRYMRFNTNVESARWDEDDKVWQVAVADGETLTARFLVTATGFLSQPCTPDIPGIADFAGKIVHTTHWDDSYDFEGTRVGVLGTGATAVQLIPELAKTAADLTVFQRTPIHVVPKQDFAIPAGLQRLFARVPFTQRIFRWFTDMQSALVFLPAVRYRELRLLANSTAHISSLQRFITIRDKELRRKLSPQYDFGCKRPTYSNDYYRTFTKPHVHLRDSGIERIDPDGVVTSDGVKTPLDALVLATGFDIWESNFPAIEIIGRGGLNLGKWWRSEGFRAYQGMTVPNFPNYLGVAAGPFANSGLSFFNMIEYQTRHMDRLFGELHRRNATTFEVTEAANNAFSDRMEALQQNTLLHLGNCAGSRSYYFGPNGETVLRPTTTRTVLAEQASFSLSDYAFE